MVSIIYIDFVNGSIWLVFRNVLLYGLQMYSNAKIEYLSMMLSRVSEQATTPDDCAT